MKDIKLIFGIILMNFESKGIREITLDYSQYKDKILVQDKITFEKVFNNGAIVNITNHSKLRIKGYNKVRRTIIEISQELITKHISNMMLYESVHRGNININTHSGVYQITDHVTIVNHKDEFYSDNVFNKLKE